MALDESKVDDAVRRRRHWRHIRTAVTLLVLVGVVVGAAWYSWHNIVNDQATTETTNTEPCAPAATALPAPADIQLNVYNATSRSGLASSVSAQMKERGFTITGVDNDPLDKEITGTAEIRSSADQQAAATLIATMVPGAVFLPDDRTTPSVDLVLGEGFEALAPVDAPATPAPTLAPCEAPAE
jgi:hypothetical protein